MAKKRKFTKEIRINVDEDLHAALFALSERRGETVSELARYSLQTLVEQKAAEDGVDIISAAIRKTMNDVLKPLENRIAAMTSKATIASATTMYTQHQLMLISGSDPQQIRSIHEDARKKAVNYIKTDTSKLTE